ncbi:MAG: hypothetical protein H0V15_01965, partial [Solirubrobacterales bacterium]|nr:hypothetical protein [Solirubrobacterales bacterium]
DQLSGGNSRDRLIGGRGADLINGGSGDDLVKARDGTRDKIDCGSGTDRLVADKIDKVRGCETVRRPGARRK